MKALRFISRMTFGLIMMHASASLADTQEQDLRKQIFIQTKDTKNDTASAGTPSTVGSMGKTSGTAIMSVITGGLMTGALRLVKDFDGLSGPFTYALLAGALLLSLYDMVRRTAGEEYSGAACWGALASTITGGLALQAVFD